MTVLFLLAAFACGAPAPERPTVSILAPADGATVAAGDVAVSFVVEHLTLSDGVATRAPQPWSPIQAAWAHEAGGEHTGTAVLRLDGVDVAEITETVYTLPGVAAGAHALEIELLDDGVDAFDPPVKATAAFTAEAP